jgi:hypothetical protein
MTARFITMGALAGLAYTLSPLTVVFAALVLPLCWWAARDLDRAERRRVLAILGVGLAVRVAAVALLLLATDPQHQHYRAFFPDAQAAIARTAWIRNIWLDVPIAPSYYAATYDPYGATPYWYTLAAIQMIVGPSPYGLNFLSTAAFLAGAVALYRLVRASYGRAAATIGFAVLVFWPTSLAWSVSVLKESVQFGLTAALIVCAVHAVRGRTRTGRLIAVAGGLAALGALNELRVGAVAIAGAGVAGGVVAHMLTVRRALALASAVAAAVVAGVALAQPVVQARLLDAVRAAGERQVGYTASFGRGYKVLDQRFYSEDGAVLSMTGDEAVRYVARSLVAFFVVPAPWQMTSMSTLGFLPQQLIWYAMLVLVVPGIVWGFRRDPLITWVFVGCIVSGTAVIAPVSGNIGTLVRHRDALMPAIVWLAVAGLWSTLGRAVQPWR